MSTVTLDPQHDFAIRLFADGIHHLLPIIQRTAIESQKTVTGFQPGSLSRTLWIEFSQHGRQCRTPWADAQRMDRIRLFSALEPFIQHQLTGRVDRRTLLANHDLQRAAFPQTADQLQIHRPPAGSRFTIDGHDFLAWV
ncbi:hypothetical protein D3C86_1644100 [compost metagenome]